MLSFSWLPIPFTRLLFIAALGRGSSFNIMRRAKCRKVTEIEGHFSQLHVHESKTKIGPPWAIITFIFTKTMRIKYELQYSYSNGCGKGGYVKEYRIFPMSIRLMLRMWVLL